MRELLNASAQGYGLWIVWVAAAILVVLGYIRVRRNIKRVERSDDSVDEVERTRNQTPVEHSTRKHNGAA